MKVLITTPSYPPHTDGLSNAVWRQAEGLAQRGIAVTVATGGPERRSRTAPSGVTIEEFAVSGADFAGNPIRGAVASYETYLLAGGFDVLILNAWQTWSTDVALRLARRIRARKFLYSHCVSTNVFLPFSPIRSLARYLLWRPYWWSLKARMRLLDGMIVLADGGDDSRFDDVRIARKIGVAVHVIPNSLPTASAPTASLVRTQLISVGSYTPAKGFDFVIRAYARSIARNRLPLLLFGQEHTGYVQELRALINKLKLEPALVQLHEGVAGALLLEEYAKSRLFLSGSWTECQPLVLLDAMAAGTPFVARATGCISRMPGGCAVRTVTEAAAEMDRLLASESEWQVLSAAGMRGAWETYAPERNAELLLRLLTTRAS